MDSREVRWKSAGGEVEARKRCEPGECARNFGATRHKGPVYRKALSCHRHGDGLPCPLSLVNSQQPYMYIGGGATTVWPLRHAPLHLHLELRAIGTE